MDARAWIRSTLQPRAILAIGFISAAVACSDGLFAPEAAPLRESGLSVYFQVAPGEPGGAATAFDRADSVRILLVRESDVEVSAALLDTLLALPAPGEERPVRLPVDVGTGSAGFLVTVELLVRGEVLFTGSAPVELRPRSTASVEPTLTPVPAAIEVAERFGPITALGNSLGLSGAAVFATGDVIPDATLRWESLDPEIVTVTEGVALAVGEGEARVMVRAGDVTVTSLVEVRAVEATLDVAPAVLELTVGESERLAVTVRDANGNALERVAAFESLGPAIVGVDATGLVRAHQEGEAVVVVRSGEVPPVNVRVSVAAVPVASVEVAPSAADLAVGESVQLRATLYDAADKVLGGRSITWQSSSPSVAGVSPTGLVTANTMGEGSVTITATSEGRSGVAEVTLLWPDPEMSALSPSEAEAGGEAFTLTVVGHGFSPQSVVQWDGSDRSTTYVTPTELQAAIPAGDLARGGTAQVTVFTPDPGGGTSGSLPFEIRANPVPVIDSLDPSSVAVSSGAVLVTVHGRDFVSESRVTVGGTDEPTVYVSPTELQVGIPTVQLTRPQVLLVAVHNPSPGGGTSNAVEFTVIGRPLTPEILSMVPNGVTSPTTEVTLTWDDPNDHEERITIQHFSDEGSPIVATLGADSVTYTHLDAVPNEENRYAVYACNIAGCSAMQENPTSVVPRKRPIATDLTYASYNGGYTVRLQGSANPRNLSAEAWFEWSTDGEVFESTDSTTLPADDTAHPVAEWLWLRGDTEYEIRFHAENDVGEVETGSRSFLTPPAEAPSASADSVAQLTATGATLWWTVYPNGADVQERHLDLSTSPSMTDPTRLTLPGPRADGPGIKTIFFSSSFGQLDPGTTYYFRASASNAVGSTVGNVFRFTTPPQ